MRNKTILRRTTKLLNCIIGETLTVTTFLICSAVSLVLGAGTAMLMKIKNKPSAGFFASLVILPLVVQTVIMLVNGNIGAGVAVAGAFGLVRFRSAQGSAREITAIFIDMAIGLATGYIGVAALLFIIVAVVYIALIFFVFAKTSEKRKILKIAIPEDYDYDNLFDEVFLRHGVKAELTKVKTTNMGTLYELRYELMPSAPLKKDFLDDIRAKNANLSVTLTSAEDEEGL